MLAVILMSGTDRQQGACLMISLTLLTAPGKHSDDDDDDDNVHA